MLRGSLSGASALGGSLTAPQGMAGNLTTGGTVSISSTEQAKVIAGNIKSGVTLLGVAGTLALPTISQDNTTKVLSIS